MHNFTLVKSCVTPLNYTCNSMRMQIYLNVNSSFVKYFTYLCIIIKLHFLCKYFTAMDEKARIKKIIEIEGLNASLFASEVGIPASTISHIFTGRNNLSSSVAQKILKRFRTISPEWLISGVGTMYRQESNSQILPLFPTDAENIYRSAISSTENPQISEMEKSTNEMKTEFLQKASQQMQINLPPVVEKPPRKIKKIIVYYDDNSFQEFTEN